MAPGYLSGRIISEPPDQPIDLRLLAEIKALRVELLHETKRSNDLIAHDVELARRMLLELKAIHSVLREIAKALV